MNWAVDFWRTFGDGRLNVFGLVVLLGYSCLYLAGAFVSIEGVRLAEQAVFFVRYDKGVAFVGAWLLCTVWYAVARQQDALREDRLIPMVLALVMLGLAALVECLVYLRMVPEVLKEGRYHDAMQNLAVVAAGSIAFLLLHWRPEASQRGKVRSKQPLHAGFEEVSARRIRNIDLFVAANLLLFSAMSLAVYRERFILYRGLENIQEFYIYACLILCFITYLWKLFRRIDVPASILVMLQIGILMHFAGGLVFSGGERLYDCRFIGVRYDKYVHFFNAFTVSLLVVFMFRTRRLFSERCLPVVTVLTVLGLGAVVELAEYVVYCTVPRNGVGGYDNNLQDLFANLGGAVIAMLLLKHATERRASS